MTKILQDEMGLIKIDADKIGHRAYEKGTACFHKLIESFGDVIVDDDGQINRRKLGEIAFSNKDKMAELTSIVWPEIRKLLIEELENIKSTAKADVARPVVALEAAVMIEAGWNDLVSVVWVIQVDRNIARDRLMARNNLSSEEATKRIDSQMSNEERSKYATYVLENNTNSEQLELETRRLFDLSMN